MKHTITFSENNSNQTFIVDDILNEIINKPADDTSRGPYPSDIMKSILNQCNSIVLRENEQGKAAVIDIITNAYKAVKRLNINFSGCENVSKAKEQNYGSLLFGLILNETALTEADACRLLDWMLELFPFKGNNHFKTLIDKLEIAISGENLLRFASKTGKVCKTDKEFGVLLNERKDACICRFATYFRIVGKINLNAKNKALIDKIKSISDINAICFDPLTTKSIKIGKDLFQVHNESVYVTNHIEKRQKELIENTLETSDFLYHLPPQQVDYPANDPLNEAKKEYEQVYNEIVALVEKFKHLDIVDFDRTKLSLEIEQFNNKIFTMIKKEKHADIVQKEYEQVYNEINTMIKKNKYLDIVSFDKAKLSLKIGPKLFDDNSN